MSQLPHNSSDEECHLKVTVSMREGVPIKLYVLLFVSGFLCRLQNVIFRIRMKEENAENK